MDTKIASFFYENGISLNVADSSSFACMVEESMKYAKQKSVIKPLPENGYQKISLTKHTSQLSSPDSCCCETVRTLLQSNNFFSWMERRAVSSDS